MNKTVQKGTFNVPHRTALVVCFMALGLTSTQTTSAPLTTDTIAPTSKDILSRADTNKDGEITEDEVDMLRGSGDGKGAWRIMKKYFDTMDVDQSGSLKPVEIEAGFSNSVITRERLDRSEGQRGARAE